MDKRDLSSEQIHYIFQNTDDAVCIISPNGKLLYANPSTEKLFNISADETIAIWEAIPFVMGNDDLVQLFIDAVINKMSSHEDIVDYYDNEGNPHQLHVRITWYKDDIEAYLIVITDLTKLFKVSSAFARYTSADIAEYVLETPEGEKRGGQSKEVTILMSDLRGFTALSAGIEPDALIDILNHYFEIMSEIIGKNKGTIIEFLGDGIFVVFGAPKTLSDHASLAVKCAIEMENAMIEVNNWNKENGYPELEMGIGINSGHAIVGNIGSENKMKYGCMGPTVNLAGRVESLTVGGQIYISEHTKKLIPEEIEIKSEVSILPKGASEKIKIYETEGIGETVLRISSDDIQWIENYHEFGCSFYKLEEKTVEEKEFEGRLLTVSTDKKYGLFSTDIELEDKMNLMLIINDEQVYAKVLARTEDGYRIRFTGGKRSEIPDS